MLVLKCFKYGYRYTQTICSKTNLLFVRQYYIFHNGTLNKLWTGVCDSKLGSLRCFATKSNTQPKRKTQPADGWRQGKKKQQSNGLRGFFIYTMPSILIATILGVLVVMTYGLMKSVKGTAREFYKDKPLGLYKSAFSKCSEDEKVISELGSPVQELIVDGKHEQVKCIQKHVKETLCVTMEFNIEGSHKRGTVSLEAVKKKEEFQFNYILVKVEDKTLVVVDNR